MLSCPVLSCASVTANVSNTLHHVHIKCAQQEAHNGRKGKAVQVSVAES